MKRLALFSAIMTLLTAGGAGALAASDHPAKSVSWYGGEYQTCSQKLSTPEIVDCVAALAARWDQRLTTAFEALSSTETPDQKERLQIAEREWVQFRNASCAYYQNRPGTIANIEFAECRRVLTAQRAIELETANQP